jgi:hypothetical protein
MIIIPANPVVYRATISGLRISSVAGTAFLDACAGLVPYADGNHRIEIYDSAGRQLVGYLSAQGAGETLDVEKLTDPGFEAWTSASNLTSYTEGSQISVAQETTEIHGGSNSCKLTENGTGGIGGSTNNSLYQSGGTAGMMLKCSAWIKRSSGAAAFQIGTGYTIAASQASAADWTQVSGYATLVLSTYMCTMGAAAASNVFFVDDASCKQVLAPSTDGVTIVSTKGGAVPNFAAVNASFTLNAASYYCIVRKMR